MDTIIPALKTKYTSERNAKLRISSYSNNNRLAMQIFGEQGEPILTATVNLPDQELPEGHVFIKDRDENEGLLTALVAAKIVEDTGRRGRSGFCEYPMCKVLIDTSGYTTMQEKLKKLGLNRG